MKYWLTVYAALATAVPALAAGDEGGANPFAGDVGTAIWTVVIFAVVLLVLGKFAWGPILDGLQSREEFIRDSLEQAKQDREAAEARLREYEDRLTKARAEATAIVEEGKRDAEEVRRKIEAQARVSSEEMVTRAKREIGIARETAIKDIYELASKVAVQVAGRVLGREIDASEHERLITRAIDELSES